MFKMTVAGKGYERVPRATTRSVHFARGHGESHEYLDAFRRIDRESGTGRYLIAPFK